jgi:hypothetical protein
MQVVATGGSSKHATATHHGCHALQQASHHSPSRNSTAETRRTGNRVSHLGSLLYKPVYGGIAFMSMNRYSLHEFHPPKSN